MDTTNKSGSIHFQARGLFQDFKYKDKFIDKSGGVVIYEEIAFQFYSDFDGEYFPVALEYLNFGGTKRYSLDEAFRGACKRI